MTARKSQIVLTDELLNVVLTRESTSYVTEQVAARIQIARSRTPQRSARRLVMPWTPLLPGLPASQAPRSMATVRVAGLLMILLLTVLAVAAFIGSQPHRPPPFGLARPGLVVFDSDGKIGLASEDGKSIQMLTSGATQDFQPTWSPDGTRFAYWSDGAATGFKRELVVFDTTRPTSRTVVVASVSDRAPWRIPWAPDSRRLAYLDDVDGIGHVFVVDTDDGRETRLDPGVAAWLDPIWSPDGTMIGFEGGMSDGDHGLYVMRADGSKLRRLALAPPGTTASLVPTWSPRGDRIAFVLPGAGYGLGIWIASVIDGTTQNISNEIGIDNEPSWAPDGNHIAWLRRATGAGGLFRIVIANPDGTGQNTLPPLLSDQTPQWSPNGTAILARGRDPVVHADGLLRIDIQTGHVVGLVTGNQGGDPSWQRLPQ